MSATHPPRADEVITIPEGNGDLTGKTMIVERSEFDDYVGSLFHVRRYNVWGTVDGVTKVISWRTRR